jgi:glycosyltransferase involved in cell wall biosynthesis
MNIEILAKFAPQIRILRKTNGGQASAFNHGIPECRGELILCRRLVGTR